MRRVGTFFRVTFSVHNGLRCAAPACGCLQGSRTPWLIDDLLQLLLSGFLCSCCFQACSAALSSLAESAALFSLQPKEEQAASGSASSAKATMEAAMMSVVQKKFAEDDAANDCGSR